MPDAELREELAILLFEQDRLTLAQAGRLARLDLLLFQHLVASRGIPLHYDLEDFEQYLSTMRDLGAFDRLSDIPLASAPSLAASVVEPCPSPPRISR